MSVQLLPQTRDLVGTLLYDEDQNKRRDALKAIVDLPDKDQVEQYLLEQFDDNSDPWRRTWSLSALAEIGLPGGMNKVLLHTANPPEDNAWVRHFALMNAANFLPFPIQEIECAIQDADVLPKATALRLLLANGEDRYADALLAMLEDPSAPDGRWAAARALRNRSDIKMQPLHHRLEARFIRCLADIAADRNVYMDTRWEAIQALASFLQKGAVAEELSNLLLRDREKDPAFRHYCLDALTGLQQLNESQAALLVAIEDADAQIRLDAAEALKAMVGAEKCIKLLLPSAMEREQNFGLIVDALRHVDPDLTAREIRDALNNPDIKISTRANQLLTMLGGQTATQILVDERARALKEYTSILSNADEDVRNHFKDLMSQAKASFWLSLGMHVTVFAIGAGVLVAVMVLGMRDGIDRISNLAGIGGAGASLLMILLSTFYKNPLQNVRGSLNALMQVDVVFLGYVRQINQIDATFKHMFLGARDFGISQMHDTVKEIQSSVTVILDEIKEHIYNK